MLVVAALAVVALALGINGTYAVFTDQATVNAGASASTAFTSGSVATPVTPTVTQQSGTGDTVVSWTSTAVTTGAGATTATTYDVLRYTAASGGTATHDLLRPSPAPPAPRPPPPAPSTTPSAPGSRPAGSRRGLGPPSPPTPRPDDRLTVSAPTDGYSNTAREPPLRGQLRHRHAARLWHDLRCRTRSSTRCAQRRAVLEHLGAAWVNAASCSFAALEAPSRRGPSRRSENTAYPTSAAGHGTIVLTVRATDGFGNSTTRTVTFTIVSRALAS